jgi:diguanylate cyclase (GGDEF)-like protein
MKRKILFIIALIMIISTVIRTVIVGVAFYNFSAKIIENEGNLLKEILCEADEREKFIQIIEKSHHIKKIEFLDKKIDESEIIADINKKEFKILIPLTHSTNKTLKITFYGEDYFNKIINAIIQLILIAIISLIAIILIVNYFLTPYLEILEKVKHSTASILKGDFNNKIDTTLKGEAKEFVNSFNTFLDKLNESFGVIEEKYTTLIEKEKSDNPLNDAKETIEQLANIFKFKRMIEEDNTVEEIYNRLVNVLEEFNIENFSIIGIDNPEQKSFKIYSKGEICCNVLDNYKSCRAFRLKKIINSYDFPNICSLHLCKNNYICIPFSASGNFTGILKINIAENEKEHIIHILPYIKAYLNEVSAIIEAKYTLDLLHNQSIKDPLTTLFNRRHLENILPMLIANAKRKNEKIAFLMIDMDYFKKVNDTYGHKAGDIVLKTLAKILKNSVRESDIVIRYGGEEFLILLQNVTDIIAAKKVAEKIRQAVENTEIQTEEATIKKTISIGISIYPDQCEKGWECIKYADLALYEAKKTGRNKVVLFNEKLISENHYDKS